MDQAAIRGRKVLLDLMNSLLLVRSNPGANFMASDVCQYINTPDVVSFLRIHRESTRKAGPVADIGVTMRPSSMPHTTELSHSNRESFLELQELYVVLTNLEFKSGVEIKFKGRSLLRFRTELIAKLFATTFLLLTFPAHALSVFSITTWAFTLSSFGYMVLLPIIIMWFASLQSRLVLLLLKQPHSVYTIFSTIVLVVAKADWCYRRYPLKLFLLNIPCFACTVLGVIMVLTGDSVLPKLRVRLLRAGCSSACLLYLMEAILSRLPGTETDKGYRVWSVLGVETISNGDVCAKFAFVLVILMSKGAWVGWRHPNRFAFLRLKACLKPPAQTDQLAIEHHCEPFRLFSIDRSIAKNSQRAGLFRSLQNQFRGNSVHGHSEDTHLDVDSRNKVECSQQLKDSLLPLVTDPVSDFDCFLEVLASESVFSVLQRGQMTHVDLEKTQCNDQKGLDSMIPVLGPKPQDIDALDVSFDTADSPLCGQFPSVLQAPQKPKVGRGADLHDEPHEPIKLESTTLLHNVPGPATKHGHTFKSNQALHASDLMVPDVGSDELVATLQTNTYMLSEAEGYDMCKVMNFERDLGHSLPIGGGLFQASRSYHEGFQRVSVALFVLITLPCQVVSNLYPSSTWAYILFALGYTVIVPGMVVFYLRLQHDIAVELLRQPRVWYILLAALFFTIAKADAELRELDRVHFFLCIPNYLCCIFCYSMIPLADAACPATRTKLLRVACPAACMILLIVSVQLRLPGAKDTEGYVVWYVLGVETFTGNSGTLE